MAEYMAECSYCGREYTESYCICVGAQMQQFYTGIVQDDIRHLTAALDRLTSVLEYGRAKK